MTQTNGSPVWSSRHSRPSRMPPSSTDVSRRACRSMASAGLRSRKIGRSLGPGDLVGDAGPPAVAVGPAHPDRLAVADLAEDDLVAAQGVVSLDRRRPRPRPERPPSATTVAVRRPAGRSPTPTAPSTRTMSYGRDAHARQRQVRQRRSLLDGADDLRPRRLPAVRADRLGRADLRPRPDRRRPTSRRRGQSTRRHHVALQGQRQRALDRPPRPRRTGRRRVASWPSRRSGRLGVGLVAQAVVAAGEPGRVELVRHPVEDQGRARRDGHPVEHLEGLLDLQRPHHRGDRRRGRDLAFEDLVAAEQGAAVPEVQELVVPRRHRAFVAGRVGRDEDLDDPLDLLDARVDPGRADLPALAVDPEPGLAVVEAADHDVDVGEQAEAEVVDHVAAEPADVDLGVDLRRPLGGDLGLGPAAVAGPGRGPTARGSRARPRRGRSRRSSRRRAAPGS